MKKNKENLVMSDFNLQKLNTTDLSEHLSASIKIGENIAIFGRRGTGKTEISKQEIKKAGMQEVYLNLSLLERVDLGGYPNIMAAAQGKKFVDFLFPQFYDLMINGDKKVVALLDEVDKVDQSLWAPLLEFTQFKSINGQLLPQLHSIIMTGNLISEGGNKPIPPLLDRTEKYLVEADSESWLRWAGSVGIHPSITAYISDNPNHLFGEVDSGDNYADPSPRGWARSSNILYKGEKLGWNFNLLNNKVSGCIGKNIGIQYNNYYEHYQQLLPMIASLFKGEDIDSYYKQLEPTKRLVLCMIVCSRLAARLDAFRKNKSSNDKLPIEVDYVGKFMQNVSSENILVSVRSQINIGRIQEFALDEHPIWKSVLELQISKV